MRDAFSHNQAFQVTALLVLAIWGAANLIGGGVLAWRATGLWQTFGQLSAAWGIVNLLIGGIQTITLRHSTAPATLSAALKGAIGTQQFITGFWISDFATVAIGIVFLLPAVAVRAAGLQGAGRALILQGAFLAIFDTVLLIAANGYTQSLLGLVP